jgi:20S proteasome alpha/beta subunit
LTVVVGIRGTSGVLLAGDSQLSTVWANRKMKAAKTCALSELVAVAYCGSFRLGQILTYHLSELEDPPLGMDEARWVVKQFVPHLRDVLEQHGFLHIHRNVENIGESAFLLAVRNRLFSVDDDLSAAESRLAYDALGSGEEVAMGSLHGAFGDEREPLRSKDERLARVAQTAIAASTEFTNFVGGDVTTVRTVRYTDAEWELAREILGR